MNATQNTIRILFTRHEEHVKQVLTTEGIERAVKRGQNLRKLGYSFDALFLSPLPRAVATAIYMTEGLGNADVPLCIEERFGDLKTDRRLSGFLDQLKEQAKTEYGNTEDASIAKCLIKMEGEALETMLLRAHEGADALNDIASNPKYKGKTILVTSHGVARMEIVLNSLAGIDGIEVLNIADKLIDRGEVIELIFENTDGKVEFKSATPLKLLDE